jgi:hypothetical protein
LWPVILIVIGAARVIEYFQGHKSEKRKEGQS